MAQLRDLDWQRLSSATARERADAFSDFYLPVTPESGRLLYALVRASRPNTVVEFGMSLGLSTIHLAAAVRDNGGGHVVTSELSAAKVGAAKATFTEVGLTDVITVEEGDALQTLAKIETPVDFVLLDGWKELYLPVLKLLEPKLTAGALVVADNTGLADTQPYVDYVRDAANGYVSVASRSANRRRHGDQLPDLSVSLPVATYPRISARCVHQLATGAQIVVR